MGKGNLEFVIDENKEVPPLLEIEAPSHEKLKEAFEELGFSMDETVNWASVKP